MRTSGFLALFLVSLLAWSQPGQYPFRKVGLEEGLPSLGINALQSEVGGYLWLATEGAGLVRYNGYDFTSYLNDEMPVINFMAAQGDSILWFANRNRLGRYNGRTFRFYTLPPETRITQLLTEDRSLWVQSAIGAMYQLQKDSLVAIPGSLPQNTSFLVRHAKSFWALADGVLYQKQGNGWESRQAVNWQKIWAGSQLVYQQNDSLYSYPNQEFLAPVNRRNLALQKGHIFLWQGQSLEWVRPEGASRTFHLGIRDESLQIKGVHLHHDGSMVVLTNQGLQILESQYLRQLGEPVGQVLALQEFEGLTAVGSANGLHFYQSGQRQKSLPQAGLVLALAQWQNRLYIGTERGLWYYKNGALQAVPALQDEFVFSLATHQGHLYLGTGAGIFKLNAQNTIEAISEQEGLPVATVFKMQEAADGSLWCATYTQGFFVKSDKGWQHLTQMGNLKLDSLRYSTFWAQDVETLWLGTQNNGLYQLSAQGQQHYTFADLRFAEVTNLQQTAACSPQEQPHLWIGTNKGWLLLQEVVAARQQQKNELNFIGQAVVPNSVHQAENQLYNGLAQGFQILNPCAFLKTEHPLRVQISGLQLLKGEANELANLANSTQAFTQLPLNPRLPYHSNYLNFNYGSPCLQRPQEILYRYRLKGQSDLWTYAGSRREVLFANLSPGRYTLEVQARRPGTNWPADSTQYGFVIKQPFYATWWFLSALGLVLLGIAVALVRDRVNRLKQRLKFENDLREMERKALRLQMNPHFIFNALDSISSFIFKKDQKQAVRYLNNFAKLMRLTLESSMEHIHPVETEVSILKNYLELEKLRFGNTFDYQIEVDEELDFDVGLPPMLVQPHVENAILHGLKPKGEGGHLHLSFTLQGPFLCVVVEDNGIGRKQAKSNPQKAGHRSMATQINKDRLKLLQSSIGEKIDLKIIDKYADDGTALGTRVVIQLPAQNI